jgi:hypothetical protein
MLATPWVSRLAAVLLLALALVAAWRLVLEPLAGSYARNAQAIAEAQDELDRYRRLAELRPALAGQLAALRERQDPRGSYLSGGTDALAAVALQERLKQVIGASGATALSVEPLPGAGEHGFRRVTLHVQLTATGEALFRTTYALESGAPVLFVANLDVQSRAAVPVADGTGAGTVPQDPVLMVGFDVYGYVPQEEP